MLDAITVSSFALIVALGSFWLSYKTYRDNSKMKSAEKRTEALQALHKALAQLDTVLKKVRQADDTKLKRSVESHFSSLSQNISEGLKWVTKGAISDAVLLEHLKAYAADVEGRVNKLPPELLEGLVETKLAKVEQVEQVRKELRGARDSANGFAESMKAWRWAGEGQPEVEATKESILQKVAEMTEELTTRINDVLASDDLSVDTVMICQEMVSDFAARVEDVRMTWELAKDL